MDASASDHGVSIKRTAVDKVLVSIEIVNLSDPDDQQAILSDAWAQLGEAIARHKAALEVSTSAESDAGEPSDAQKNAPGSGAWWSQ